MSRLSRLFEIGIINTIKLNFHYFSFRDAIRFPVLASKRLRIKKMDGAISLGTIKTGIVTLGFDSVGLFDAKKDRSILEIGKDAHLEFQGKARLGNGFKIILIEQGHLTIGSGFILTANSSIVCCDHIMIGSNSLFHGIF